MLAVNHSAVHSTDRPWRLEDAIVADLVKFKMPDDEVAEWFRTSLQTAFTDIADLQRNQRIAQTKRRSELSTMNDRLLNAFLAGLIDEPARPDGRCGDFRRLMLNPRMPPCLRSAHGGSTPN